MRALLRILAPTAVFVLTAGCASTSGTSQNTKSLTPQVELTLTDVTGTKGSYIVNCPAIVEKDKCLVALAGEKSHTFAEVRRTFPARCDGQGDEDACAVLGVVEQIYGREDLAIIWREKKCLNGGSCLDADQYHEAHPSSPGAATWKVRRCGGIEATCDESIKEAKKSNQFDQAQAMLELTCIAGGHNHCLEASKGAKDHATRVKLLRSGCQRRTQESRVSNRDGCYELIPLVAKDSEDELIFVLSVLAQSDRYDGSHKMPKAMPKESTMRILSKLEANCLKATPELKAEACAFAAWYAGSFGILPNTEKIWKKAISFREMSCDAGNLDQCRIASEIHWNHERFEPAKRMYERYCTIDKIAHWQCGNYLVLLIKAGRQSDAEKLGNYLCDTKNDQAAGVCLNVVQALSGAKQCGEARRFASVCQKNFPGDSGLACGEVKCPPTW